MVNQSGGHSMQVDTKRVSSFDEWGSLREVIVGTAQGAARPAYEPAFSGLFAPGSSDRLFPGAPFTEQEISDAERQLDAFASVLEGLGIVVQRPERIDHSSGYATPDWKVPFGRGQACPRDVLLVIGDEIIEASMARRCRFFEYRAYRKLIQDYFRDGARWTTAPKPLMSGSLYTAGYSTVEEGYDLKMHPMLTEYEPCFDAACFARCGKDIFWQPDLVSNQFGADWLARHLGPEYRIHRVEFEKRTPTHIDTTLVPIGPKVALVNPERPFKQPESERLFKDNGWKLIAAPPSVRSITPFDPDVSNWISMNVLCLDPKTVIVEAAEDPMVNLLESLGWDVIRCPFDAVIKFGGSFHCCTVDIRRDGCLTSYFPELDE